MRGLGRGRGVLWWQWWVSHDSNKDVAGRNDVIIIIVDAVF